MIYRIVSDDRHLKLIAKSVGISYSLVHSILTEILRISKPSQMGHQNASEDWYFPDTSDSLSGLS